MLSGPETTRILHQFEEQYLLNSEESTDRTNHEMGLSAQKTFKQQVNNLADVIKRMGNPFLDDFPELVTMDSRDCMDDAVAESVINLRQLGKTQCQEYVKAVIKDRTISITISITKNKFPLSANNLRVPNRSSRRQSKHCRTTSPYLLNCTLLCRTAMQTLENSFATRYSHFLHHCLNLEIFVSQVTSPS